MSLVGMAAARAGVTEDELRRVLDRYDVNLDADRTPERHGLVLTRIAFTGFKIHPDENREINFDVQLDPGVWAVASDRNLTGKTSVIAIAKWALRGAYDEDLPDPVLGWLDHVEVEGAVDTLPFAVEFDPRDSSGTLTVGGADAASTTRFSGRIEFEQVMCEFFESRLALPQIAWFQSDGNDGGRPTAHGWHAYVGALWVSDARKDLLFGETHFGSLPQRLLNVFIAVPWAPASFELLRAAKLAAATRPSADPTIVARAALAEEMADRLEALRSEQATQVDPTTALDAVMAATTSWRAAEAATTRAREEFDRLDARRRDVGNDLVLARRQLAAARMLTALEPSRCPRCSQAVTATESSEESCYVCTRPVPHEAAVGDDALDLLELDHQTAKAAAEEASGDVRDTDRELRDAAAELTRAKNALPAPGDNSIATAIEIARIEGALDALERDLGAAGPQDGDDDARTLTNARKEVEGVRSGEFKTRLATVNERLAQIVIDLGFTNVDEARLTVQGGMEVTYTGGHTVPFKKLAEGEKLRARLAAVLSMIESTECRHPGLIVHDSIADTELNAQDLATLLTYLHAGAEEAGVQVIVTLADLDAAISVLGEDRVIGPGTPAGHIF